MPWLTGSEFASAAARLEKTGYLIQSFDVKGSRYRIRHVFKTSGKDTVPVSLAPIQLDLLEIPARKTRLVKPNSPRAQQLFAFMRSAV